MKYNKTDQESSIIYYWKGNFGINNKLAIQPPEYLTTFVGFYDRQNKRDLKASGRNLLLKLFLPPVQSAQVFDISNFLFY